jgi:hypothetical protein
VRLLQINSLELVGGDRRIELEPGVNIVLGPIATGKSTVVKLIRALFTTIPDDLAPEARDNVASLRSGCTIAVNDWNILRRLVSTDTALVEIVGNDQSVLVPAKRPTPAHPDTFPDWLLGQLDIPAISVPAAPTRPESDPSPVTFTDFFNLCVLRGDEIDNCVFGHTHPYRDIKRKYVFEIVQGLYDASFAEIQAELRVTEQELTFLRGQAAAATRIFAGTELESIEAVRVALEQRIRREAEIVRGEAEMATTARANEPAGDQLRLLVESLSNQLVEATSTARTAEAQLSDLEALVEQLRSQEGRLTRAAVAGEALVDFEFLLCPRCGHHLDAGRGSEASCVLCLQEPREGVTPEALRAERDRIEDQVVDTLDLIENRRAEVESLRQKAIALQVERADLGRRLDELTASFVSDHQEELTAIASERATVHSEIEKYRQYLAILERAENADLRIAALAEKRAAIRLQLEEASTQLRLGQSNVSAMEGRLATYLERLHVPTFGEPLTASIDRKTYLPVVSGRSFESLSSQGLQVLVNVAYALALHTVAADRNLPLPGLIDGPSSNVGTEGYDSERLADMYALLSEISSTYGDRLQIIVVDNHIPPGNDDRVRLRLGEDDRLIRIAGREGVSDMSAA